MKTKKHFLIFSFALILLNFLFLSACKKDENAENPDTPDVTDIDGNGYNSVTIGSQTWLATNLKTTRLSDGTPIPLVTDNVAWSELTSPGYCWYNNDEAASKPSYGAMYNWYAVNTGKLCPTGWHVPTDDEWQVLIEYAGGSDTAAAKLKEAGTTHWLNGNPGATNETGFTALPGGFRYLNGSYTTLGVSGNWWSSTAMNDEFSWLRCMKNHNSQVIRSHDYFQNGISVRCLKD